MARSVGAHTDISHPSVCLEPDKILRWTKSHLDVGFQPYTGRPLHTVKPGRGHIARQALFILGLLPASSGNGYQGNAEKMREVSRHEHRDPSQTNRREKARRIRARLQSCRNRLQMNWASSPAGHSFAALQGPHCKVLATSPAREARIRRQPHAQAWGACCQPDLRARLAGESEMICLEWHACTCEIRSLSNPDQTSCRFGMKIHS